MNILNYIAERALQLVPVLYVIGVFLKSTPKLPGWVIPWILTLLGIIGSCAFIGISADGVTQGILAAGATVLGNQLYKQTTKRD